MRQSAQTWMASPFRRAERMTLQERKPSALRLFAARAGRALLFAALASQLMYEPASADVTHPDTQEAPPFKLSLNNARALAYKHLNVAIPQLQSRLHVACCKLTPMTQAHISFLRQLCPDQAMYRQPENRLRALIVPATTAPTEWRPRNSPRARRSQKTGRRLRNCGCDVPPCTQMTTQVSSV